MSAYQKDEGKWNLTVLRFLQFKPCGTFINTKKIVRNIID